MKLKSLILAIITFLSPGTASLWIGDCNKPLGLSSMDLPDAALTASSSHDLIVGPQNARLGRETGGGAWCPRHPVDPSQREWLQVDLCSPHLITGVGTQGRFAHQGVEFTPAYTLQVMPPGIHIFQNYTSFDNPNKTVLLSGNSDTFTEVRNDLEYVLLAVKVRVRPYAWHPRVVCLRLELYGCPYSDGLQFYTVEDREDVFEVGKGALFDGRYSTPAGGSEGESLGAEAEGSISVRSNSSQIVKKESGVWDTGVHLAAKKDAGKGETNMASDIPQESIGQGDLAQRVIPSQGVIPVDSQALEGNRTHPGSDDVLSGDEGSLDPTPEERDPWLANVSTVSATTSTMDTTRPVDDVMSHLFHDYVGQDSTEDVATDDGNVSLVLPSLPAGELIAPEIPLKVCFVFTQRRIFKKMYLFFSPVHKLFLGIQGHINASVYFDPGQKIPPADPQTSTALTFSFPLPTTEGNFTLGLNDEEAKVVGLLVQVSFVEVDLQEVYFESEICKLCSDDLSEQSDKSDHNETLLSKSRKGLIHRIASKLRTTFNVPPHHTKDHVAFVMNSTEGTHVIWGQSESSGTDKHSVWVVHAVSSHITHIGVVIGFSIAAVCLVFVWAIVWMKLGRSKGSERMFERNVHETLDTMCLVEGIPLETNGASPYYEEVGTASSFGESMNIPLVSAIRSHRGKPSNYKGSFATRASSVTLFQRAAKSREEKKSWCPLAFHKKRKQKNFEEFLGSTEPLPDSHVSPTQQFQPVAAAACRQGTWPRQLRKCF